MQTKEIIERRRNAKTDQDVKEASRSKCGCGMLLDIYRDFIASNSLISYRSKSLSRYDQRNTSRYTRRCAVINKYLYFVIALALAILVLLHVSEKLGTVKSQTIENIRRDTQKFTMTGQLIPVHYVALFQDNPASSATANLKTKVVDHHFEKQGKATKAEYTLEEYEEAMCHYASAGIRQTNKVYLDHSNQETQTQEEVDKITETSNLFFKMKCMVHDLQKSYIDQDQHQYLLHFFYEATADPIKGMNTKHGTH